MIGDVARGRREQLGFRQDELSQYGGPGTATVGKFERAAQDRFPTRTQQQMERALGWPAGSIQRYVAAVDSGDREAEAMTSELLFDNVPQPPVPLDDGTTTVDLGDAVRTMSFLLSLVPTAARPDAVRAATLALMQYAHPRAGLSVSPITGAITQDGLGDPAVDQQDLYDTAARRPGRRSASDLQREAQDRDAES